MGESTSQIREELDQYRDSASGRLAEIENRVGSMADEARGIADDARTEVQETVEQVRQTFDFKYQVKENPLVVVGAGLLAGFVLGGGLSGGGGGGGRQSYGSSGSGPGISAHLNRTIRDAARSAGLNDTVSAAGSALVQQLTGSVRASVDQNRQRSLNEDGSQR